jgi:hypothetical protein
MRGHCCCCSKEREEQGGKRRFHVRTDCFTKNKSAESEFISTDRSVPTGCIMVWNGGYMVVERETTRGWSVSKLSLKLPLPNLK